MAKKELLFLSTIILGIILLSYVQASFTIEKEKVNDVVAVELTIPAKYDITINNKGPASSFEFVALVDVVISPKFTEIVPASKSLTVPVSFLPNYRVRYSIYYPFYIRDDLGMLVKENI